MTSTPTGTFRAAPGNDQPSVTELRLAGRPDHLAGTLVEGGTELNFSVGRGQWAVTDALAASGAELDGDARIDVVFLEIPHRLQLTVPAGSDQFIARWVTAPLWDPPLTQLRMPR
jgi:hypothetical protein